MELDLDLTVCSSVEAQEGDLDILMGISVPDEEKAICRSNGSNDDPNEEEKGDSVKSMLLFRSSGGCCCCPCEVDREGEPLRWLLRSLNLLKNSYRDDDGSK